MGLLWDDAKSYDNLISSKDAYNDLKNGNFVNEMSSAFSSDSELSKINKQNKEKGGLFQGLGNMFGNAAKSLTDGNGIQTLAGAITPLLSGQKLNAGTLLTTGLQLFANMQNRKDNGSDKWKEAAQELNYKTAMIDQKNAQMLSELYHLKNEISEAKMEAKQASNSAIMMGMMANNNMQQQNNQLQGAIAQAQGIQNEALQDPNSLQADASNVQTDAQENIVDAQPQQDASAGTDASNSQNDAGTSGATDEPIKNTGSEKSKDTGKSKGSGKSKSSGSKKTKSDLSKQVASSKNSKKSGKSKGSGKQKVNA